MMKRKMVTERPLSLSRGYQRLSQILLFCGILLTGVVMICSAINVYMDTVKDAQLKNCDALSSTLTDIYKESGRILSEESIRSIQTTEREYQYVVSLYDSSGNPLYSRTGEKLSATMISYLKSSDYLQPGYFTQNAQDLQMCCAIRFYSQAPDGSVDWFYLETISDAANIASYVRLLTISLVVCLLLFMLLFMVLFQIGSKHNDKQFEEINHVVQQYANGNFDVRVEIPEHDRLYPFACTLNRMAEFIEQNESTRRNFVANVSHELRTPMTTIGGFAGCMLDGTIPEEEHPKYIRIISEEIQRLRTLINSMLNLSKFEAGEMQLRCKNFDAAGLLIKTVLMFEKRINDKKVDVEGLEDASLMIHADEDLIFQVLYNLIENAVKFVNEGGVISFSLRTQDNIAYIMVKNTGEGLSDDELPKIFDRFYKTDTSRSKDKTGLGLGLSIARKIVHLHNGHIVVKSVKGEYTSFEVQIPVNAS